MTPHIDTVTSWCLILMIALAIGIGIDCLVNGSGDMTPRECHHARTYAESATELEAVMQECGDTHPTGTEN